MVLRFVAVGGDFVRFEVPENLKSSVRRPGATGEEPGKPECSEAEVPQIACDLAWVAKFVAVGGVSDSFDHRILRLQSAKPRTESLTIGVPLFDRIWIFPSP